MKVWELIAKLEGSNPDAEVLVQDGQLTLTVEEAIIDPPAESARRVLLVVSD